MPDLGILDVYLQSTQSMHITAHMGRAVQFAFLQAIGSQDEILATQLHDGHGLKPYTVTGLLQLDSYRPLMGDIQIGQKARVRFTCLSAEIVDALVAWLGTAQSIEMNHMLWQVTDARWERQHSYAEIITSHELASPQMSFSFRLLSPMCFKSMGQYFAMPTPRLVFNNLIDRWHIFSGINVPPDFRDFVDQYVIIADYKLHSQSLVMKRGTQIKGCMGKVAYSVSKTNKTFEKNHPQAAKEIKQNRLSHMRLVGMLHEFANYSGVGIKTTQGMGAVKTS